MSYSFSLYLDSFTHSSATYTHILVQIDGHKLLEFTLVPSSHSTTRLTNSVMLGEWSSRGSERMDCILAVIASTFLL